MKYYLSLLALLITFFAPNEVRAESFACDKELAKSSHAEYLDKVEARYKELQSLKANFFQESFFLGLGQKKLSRGELSFKKPGKMNWSYSEPEKQFFTANGSSMWFYQPEVNQVTISDFKDSFDSDLPVSFLFGVGSLKENFNVKKACKTEDGLLFELKSKKEDSTIEQFNLLVSNSDYSPVGAKTIDIGGNETTIKLEVITYNPDLANAMFEFNIPKGVDVIDQRKTDEGTGREEHGEGNAG